MVAADEVPPHHDLLTQRLTADQQQPGFAFDAQLFTPGRQVDQVIGRDLRAVDPCGASVQEHPVFKAAVQSQFQRAREQDLGAEQRWGVGGHWRDTAHQ
ncbi:hypothetical protein GCM10027456_30120 [Kineosporia babensis]